MFNITSKYFSFFNNTSLATWVAHTTRNVILHVVPVHIIVSWWKVTENSWLKRQRNQVYE